LTSRRFLIRLCPLSSHRISLQPAPLCLLKMLPTRMLLSQPRAQLRSLATSGPTACTVPSGCCGSCGRGSNAAGSLVTAAPAPDATASGGRFECWKCRHDVRDAMFCRACGCVQSLDCCQRQQTSSFAVFDMAPSFDIDGDALEAAFKSLQRRVHPDSFYSKSRSGFILLPFCLV
jgi:hypothetical protein